jgi:Zn-dependent M16 (insulinase) family peptidase
VFDLATFLSVGQILVPLSLIGPPVFFELSRQRIHPIFYAVILILNIIELLIFGAALEYSLLKQAQWLTLGLTLSMMFLVFISYLFLNGPFIFRLITKPSEDFADQLDS